jgi:hypothetical protein
MNFLKNILVMTVLTTPLFVQAHSKREVNAQLNTSPALMGLKNGIENQYSVNCEAFEVITLVNSTFQAKAYCTDKNATGDEASGVILTVDGDSFVDSPLLISNIKIDFAG